MTSLIKYMEAIPGIGTISGNKLINKYNLKTPADLKSHIHELPIITQTFMKHKPVSKIPRALITKVKNKLGKSAVIAGSYRRGKKFSRDIDIIWLGKNIEDVPQLLQKKGMIKKYIVYAKGSKKMHLIAYFNNPKIKAQIDIYKANKANLGSFMLFLTGDGQFNIFMRKIATEKSMLLNQDGLFKIKRKGNVVKKKKLPVKTERQIFKKLGIKYLPPEKRVGWGGQR